jgi:DNA-binding MarR family transcriptional regulator
VLSLSEEGASLYAEISPLALAYEAALISGLSPEDVATLKRLLARLQQVAGQLSGEAPTAAI